MVRLTIPTLFISLPCEERKQGNGQNIMDRPNCAVCWKWGNLTVIADHSQQGFNRINRAIVGRTRAYYARKGYICDVSEIGHIYITNEGNRLYRADGCPVNKAWAGGLCLYTCISKSAPNKVDVRLTHWRAL